MWNLIKICNGDRIIIMTNTRVNVVKRRKQLLDSQRKMKVEYVIEKTDTRIKYSEKARDGSWRSGDRQEPKHVE